MLSVFLLVSASAWALPAAAQDSPALQNSTCAGTRDGSDLLCTAGEFTVEAVVQESTGTLPTCTIGGNAEINIDVNLIGSNTDRYDAGFFVGQTGNDPRIAGSGQCSVATFPTSPAPFEDNDGDACGDFDGGGNSTITITAIKVACAFGTDPADPTTYGKLLLPYTLTYWQNDGEVCTGPATVNSGSKSKCNAGVGSVSGVNLQGFLSITKQTIPDGDPAVFNFTATNSRGAFFDATDASFTLTDGQTRTIEAIVDTTTQTISVTEALSPGWSETASISCVDYLGNGVAGYVTTNGATRTITAALDLQHPAVDCTITNVKGVPLTLSKAWVNGNPGDAVRLTTTGAPSNIDFTATVDNPTETDTGAPIVVSSGNVITFAENFTNGSSANYAPGVLTCTGNANALAGNQLTVSPSDTAIECVFTNTRRSATLTLAKTWSNATVNDAVTISTTGAANNDSFAAVADAANQTDTDDTPVTVFAGEAITFSELFTTGLPGNYASTLACSGSTGLAGSVLTVGAADTAITCTYTNARAPVSLTIRKQWQNAIVNDAVTVSTVGGINSASLDSIANTPTELDVDDQSIEVFAGESITIGEVFTTGSAANYLSSLACTGNAAPVVGNTVTVSVGDTAIVCTETNARRVATLALSKTWQNAIVGDAVTITGTGGVNTATFNATAAGPNGATGDGGTAVFVGEQITLTESFTTGNGANYTQTLACSGNNTPLAGNVLTVNAADTTISCGFTNVRNAGTLTLAKSWVNAAISNAVTITASGGANANVLASVAGAANEVDTGAPVAISSGEVITITEAFTVGDPANYVSSLSCTGLGAGSTLVGNVLTIGSTPGTITCTETNIRAAGTLAVAKTWVNAAVGNAVTVTASGGASTATVASTAGTANETDVGAPVAVSVGEVFTISENFTSGSSAGYSSSLACTGLGNGTTLVGNTLTIGATPGQIVCTETNTRTAGTLAVAKTWVNAVVGNAVTVSASGGANTATVASVAGSANETDTGAPVDVTPGEVFTISETFTVGSNAAYNSSLACTGLGNGTTLVGNTLTIGATPGNIVCTETNARGAGTLAVAKTWVNAAVGNAVTVTASGGASTATVASTAGTANETDVGAPVVVSVGEVFTISENFTNGSSAGYSSSLACTGLGNGTTLVGNTLTIGATPGNIVCTETNTRAAGTLAVAKTWVNAAVGNAVTVTASGGVNTATVASVAGSANETDNGASVVVSAGEVFTISENFTSGNSAGYVASLACTGLGEGTTLVGNVLTLGSAPGQVVCTQTNARLAGTLTLAKRWVNARLADSVTVSASGGANPVSLASVAGAANETDTGVPVQVSAGDVLTITENFTTGAAGNYIATLACTGLGQGGSLVGNVLTVGQSPGAIVCTQTNTRRSATVSLRKTWADAIVDDAVTVTSTSNEGTASNFASVANAANETDTGTAFTAYAGEVLTFTEAFTVGAAGNYAATLSCTGNASPVAGNSVTVGAGDTALVCGFTNTRVGTTLTLRKTWINATLNDAVTVSGTGGATAASLASVANAANETDTGAPVAVLVGNAITISESYTTGSAAAYTSSLSCTGNATPLAGNVLTVTAGDGPIVCTETNSRILFPRLDVTKTAGAANFEIGQSATYTITVTNGGEVPTSGDITLVDPLPVGIRMTSASGTNWTCVGTNSATCTYTGTLAVGASTSVTLNVNVLIEALTGNNVATASGGGDPTCPQAAHCIGTVAVPVQFSTGNALVIVKSANPVRVNAGSLVLYTLQVTNIVNYAVVGARVVDMPPAGLAYVPGSGTIYDSIAANNAVSGARPIVFSGVDVGVGQTIRIQYLLRAGAALANGEYTNFAQAFRGVTPISNVASFTVYAQTGADPLLEQTRILGKVFDDQDGDGWQDPGERGVPGVRIASVTGLISETDAYGRYHQEGIVLPNQERGMNYVLKLDRATLPPGSAITTENPLIRRITAAIPARFDFGVKLPPAPMASTRQEDLVLGEINFTPGSVEIRPEYQVVLDRMAGEIHAHQSGEVFIDSASGNSPLAFERAGRVRDELASRLSPEEKNAFTITVRLQAADGTTGTVGLSDEILLGQVFFDTDKSTIRPEFEGLLDKIAANIESVGSGRVSIVGHADLRASTEYNQALGMRRANSVYDAIAKRLSPEARTKLSVEVDGAVVAPGAGQ